MTQKGLLNIADVFSRPYPHGIIYFLARPNCKNRTYSFADHNKTVII